MADKTEGQLTAAKKKETIAKNNDDLEKQSLTDEMKYANKDVDAAKKGLLRALRSRQQPRMTRARPPRTSTKM